MHIMDRKDLHVKNQLREKFETAFGRPAKYLFSAPGRTELGGNHTDHQHGRVLAAAVDLDTTAAVATNGTRTVRILSEGYPLCEVLLSDLTVKPKEAGTTAALIRGTIARFAQIGCGMEGFDAYVTSRVMPGSGLSSSAAFEVLIGTIINHLFFARRLTAVEVAQIGQWAENVYFGKPCGLMDQLSSAVGGVVSIDFNDPVHPLVEPVSFDFSACGHALCIIDTGADHSGLTDEYAAIPAELRSICRYFGKEYLREVPEEQFYSDLTGVRQAAGDRAVLRAIHFYQDNDRVLSQVNALRQNDFAGFLRCVAESGRSSWMYLQNVIPAGRTLHQETAFALALAERLLDGRGACRIHGGGFAGTIQAFVPLEMLESFKRGMERALGPNCCHTLSLRSTGGILAEDWTNDQ